MHRFYEGALVKAKFTSPILTLTNTVVLVLGSVIEPLADLLYISLVPLPGPVSHA